MRRSLFILHLGVVSTAAWFGKTRRVGVDTAIACGAITETQNEDKVDCYLD